MDEVSGLETPSARVVMEPAIAAAWWSSIATAVNRRC
jgi:hypothetical protein